MTEYGGSGDESDNDNGGGIGVEMLYAWNS